MVKDRSEEMLIQRARGLFGGRSILCSESGLFGSTEEDWQRFSSSRDLTAIIFGQWTKTEVLFLLKNKRNAIRPEGDSITALYCPNERRDEIIQILREEFGKLTFGGGESGRPYISVDNMTHILFIGEEACDFLMHCD